MSLRDDFLLVAFSSVILLLCWLLYRLLLRVGNFFFGPGPEFTTYPVAESPWQPGAPSEAIETQPSNSEVDTQKSSPQSRISGHSEEPKREDTVREPRRQEPLRQGRPQAAASSELERQRDFSHGQPDRSAPGTSEPADQHDVLNTIDTITVLNAANSMSYNPGPVSVDTSSSGSGFNGFGGGSTGGGGAGGSW